MEQISQRLKEKKYSISVGIECRHNEVGLYSLVQAADAMMLRNKVEYYGGKNSRLR